MEVYTENWGSRLSKQSYRSYYMLLSQVEELEKQAENLQILIQKAAEKTIPKRKPSSRSKP